MAKRSDYGFDNPQGMTLLDYFAGQASEDDIQNFIPTRQSGVVVLMVELGIIAPVPPDKSIGFGSAEMAQLRAWARYQCASFMLVEKARREKL
jgi:hypothetical protein